MSPAFPDVPASKSGCRYSEEDFAQRRLSWSWREQSFILDMDIFNPQEKSMLLQEVKKQVFKLPPSDRLALVSAIIESLQSQPISEADRSGAIQRMRGLLKTAQPAPTDEEVAAMLDARRVEKYL